MQPIPIHRSKEDVLHQWDCIFQIDDFNKKREFGGIAKAVLLLSLFVLLLYVFTPQGSLIVLKGVSLMFVALAWAILLPAVLWQVVKRIKTRRDIRREVVEELKSGKQYYVLFDEEGLTYGAQDFKTELLWTYFFARLETPTTLLLFFKAGTSSFQALTSSEIREDNLQSLKAIVEQKLPVLNEKIHLKDRIQRQEE
jgi:hypothetical protein